MKIDPRIAMTLRQIMLMNFGFFGIQYSFGLQQTAITPVFEVQHQQLALTLSVGAADCAVGSERMADVGKAVQLAMRAAQKQPGNSAVIYTDDLLVREPVHHRIHAHIGRALEAAGLDAVLFRERSDLLDR